MKKLHCLLGLGAAACLLGQSNSPTAYSVTQVNALFGDGLTQTIYRDGSKAVIDTTRTGGHTRSLYDLQTHINLSWDVNAPQNGCGKATFSGDWGDPFAMAKELTDGAKESGTETVNGMQAKVMEASMPQGKIKAWMDAKTGLPLKVVMTPSSGPAQTMIDVKKVSYEKPPASVFVLPAGCAAAAGASAPPTEAETIAKETGGNAADFVRALNPPGSSNSCSVLMRVVHAGSMQPIPDVQIAIDTTYDIDHPPHYSTGISASGKATFSGGGMHELTSQVRNGVLRIENVPPHFYVSAHFGKGGDSDALLYRQCFAQQEVLLLVVKNPNQLSDGADWLWVRSGRYAAIDAGR